MGYTEYYEPLLHTISTYWVLIQKQKTQPPRTWKIQPPIYCRIAKNPILANLLALIHRTHQPHTTIQGYNRHLLNLVLTYKDKENGGTTWELKKHRYHVANS